LIARAASRTLGRASEEEEMLARTGLDAQEALVCTMVLVAAAGRGISDAEIGVMAGLVQTLPAFRTFSTERLNAATEAAVALLREDDGLAHAGALIREALEPRLRETAYALACEVIAAERAADQDSLRMLEFVKAELRLDPLVAAAIERGARARHQHIEPPRG
jgi:tellurite resistance protein